MFHCICCEKELTTAFGGDVDKHNDPPGGGTAWTTRGNYGSAIYDDINSPSHLEIVICDECLPKLIKKKFVREVEVIEIKKVVSRLYEDKEYLKTKEPNG